jgi:hypothetical protein
MRSRHSGSFIMVAVLLLGGVLVPTPAVQAAGAWTPATPLHTPGTPYTATLLPGGEVLVVSSTAAERYAPDANMWSATSPKTTPAAGQAILLPSGQVLVIGAEAAERYDPTANVWTSIAPRATAATSSNPTALLLASGQVLVIAGAQAERYDPAANVWTPAAAPFTPRNNATLTLLADGQVLVAGGSPANCTSAASCNVVLATAERYDPNTDRWRSAAPMANGRVGHTATRLSDGQVLVVGGISATGATAERYDPNTDRWIPAGTVPASTPPSQYPVVLAYHQATVLADGRVLVTGGRSILAGSDLASTAIYDPEAKSWAAATAMSGARSGHTATRLLDGRVLVAGGTAGTSTELYAGDQAAACFVQTDTCVTGQFLNYWRQHGGLALNGYPLRFPFTQQLEDGKTYTVQYFERTRLEAHPEHQPPYDILLGQFGRHFHPADPSATPQTDAVFFQETGHNLSGRFREYWEANGGLAQFGYPLSEVFQEQLEDGQTYQVQYFERARFELHPRNQAPYDVLLGQFGRRILAESGRQVTVQMR